MKVSTYMQPGDMSPSFALIEESDQDRIFLKLFVEDRRINDKDLAFHGYCAELGKGITSFNFGLRAKEVKKPSVFWAILLAAVYGFVMLFAGYLFFKISTAR